MFPKSFGCYYTTLHVISRLVAGVTGKVKTLFAMRFLAGRAPGQNATFVSSVVGFPNVSFVSFRLYASILLSVNATFLPTLCSINLVRLLGDVLRGFNRTILISLIVYRNYFALQFIITIFCDFSCKDNLKNIIIHRC